MKRVLLLVCLLAWVTVAWAEGYGYSGDGYSGGQYGRGYASAKGYAKPIGLGTVNLLADSETFETDAWTLPHADLTLSRGRVDPLGGFGASRLLSRDGSSFISTETTATIVLDYQWITHSIYAKEGTAPTSGFKYVENGTVRGPTLNWSGGTPSFSGSSFDNQGAEDMGGGWWRVWYDVDLNNIGVQGNAFTSRIIPWLGSTTTGHYADFFGVQLEPGAGPPGPYTKRPIAPPSNILPDSWDFFSTFWKGNHVSIDETGGQADPFGGNKAFLMENIGGASAWYQENSTQFDVSTDRVVLSAYFKHGAGTLSGGNLRFYNAGLGKIAATSYTWSGSVMSHGSSTFDGLTETYCTGGVNDIGNGWYQVYIAVDLKESNWLETQAKEIRMMLWGGDSDAGDQLYVTGVQFELGLIPSTYKERP